MRKIRSYLQIFLTMVSIVALVYLKLYKPSLLSIGQDVLPISVKLKPKLNQIQPSLPGIEKDFSKQDNTISNRYKIQPSRPHIEGDLLSGMPNITACPSVLDNMILGSWKQRPMTQTQREEIENFNNYLVRVKLVPWNIQRADSLCGNVTYSSPWIRANCDSHGETPCCYDNKCVSKTTEECKCENCLDLRTRIIAEYADWIPTDERCRVKTFDQTDACDLLSGQVIAVVGDSMARHFYIALLLLLQNNSFDGVLKSNTPSEIKKECLSLEILTDKVCRFHIARDISVCSGTVKLILKEYKNIKYLHATMKLLRSLPKSSKSLVLLGIGVHDEYNTTAVINSYLKHLIQSYRDLGNPNTKLVWATPSNYGLFKADRHPQSKSDVSKFMKETGDFLSAARIPQFNTYHLTTGVRSQDGHHYGLGVNKWKAFILLNYLRELQTQGQW